MMQNPCLCPAGCGQGGNETRNQKSLLMFYILSFHFLQDIETDFQFLSLLLLYFVRLTHHEN